MEDSALGVVVSQQGQSISDLTTKVQMLETTLTQQEKEVVDARSSTFVRWGKSSCSTGSDLIYSGKNYQNNHGTA